MAYTLYPFAYTLHRLRSSRESATIYRSGNAAGVTGPTGFLPAGKIHKKGYSDKFLLESGAPPGSTVIMTKTGYMTEEAWVEMAPFMCKGIRAMPVIKGVPE
jgi:hypothetical protein